MSIRALFAILVAIAMSFAPVAMQSGMAMAVAPADHQSEIANQEHCGLQQDERDADKAMDKSCCAAMCGNIVIAPAAPVDPLAYGRGIDQPAIASIGAGFLAKLPTPPPRAA